MKFISVQENRRHHDTEQIDIYKRGNGMKRTAGCAVSQPVPIQNSKKETSRPFRDLRVNKI